MKSSVETLSTTRVKLSIEVPFEELRPAVDAAYRRAAKQVRVKGFRPGKVPPRILDQHIGRGAIVEDALQAAVPHFYGEAVAEAKLQAVGRPEIEVATYGDGAPLVFSATVDVRPEIQLPAYDTLRVTVEPLRVTDADVDRQLDALRDRFGTLVPVDRPVQVGDYVVLDISATREGELVPGSEASGLSYEVGTAGLVPGLDRVLVGMSAGERKAFDAEIGYGELAGTLATFQVAVTSVRVKEVPPPDDGFAKQASEFDTLEELRGGLRERIEQVRRLDQAVQARDRTLDALLDRVDVPFPIAMLAREYHWRKERFDAQIAEAGLTMERFLAESGKTAADVEQEMRRACEHSVKAQLVLDAIAAQEELAVTEAELTDQVVRRAAQAGVRADEYADRLVAADELSELIEEIRRGKALATVMEAVTILDTAGNRIDLSSLRDDATDPEAMAAP